MTENRSASFSFPVTLLQAADLAARARLLPLAGLLRRLSAEIERGRTERRIIRAALTVADALEPEFRQATGWHDLQRRLKARGFVLRLDHPGALALHVWPEDRRLPPIGLFGWSLPSLSVRFRESFPGRRPARPAPPVVGSGHDRVADGRSRMV